MKTQVHKICLIVLLFAGMAWSEEADSLFPAADEVKTDKQPSLESAITQFEDIVKDSPVGEMETLASNDQYNRDRVVELRQKLQQKQTYLEAMPNLISQRFEDLMRQYPDADQKTKNRMAEELHAKWKSKEEQAQREIQELQEQLAVTTGRMSESAVKRQMLDISGALSDSERALSDITTEKPDPQAQSAIFQSMLGLSQKRMLSMISEFCPVNVKPLDTELSLSYLDN
jgi:DNA repair exonuclease SbcCD ATPase subunit